MKRYGVIASVCLLAVVAVLLLFAIAYKSPAQREIESLAQFVLDNGHSTYVSAKSLRYFGIPADHASFLQLEDTSVSGRIRAIQVRRRKDSGILDILLADLRPTSAGRFYLTGTHRRLMKAGFLDRYPEPVDGAQQRFEDELDFWMLWVQTKRTRLANLRTRQSSAPRANPRGAG
jgi:hypothetical protein